jgi:carboxylate-amine ligase
VAVATPVLDEAEVATTRNPRYERIVHDFGATAERMVVCGMHVHVDVSDEDEGVGVLDGVRPWLPVLLALSVNSPFAWGRDTGHASWRSQVWGRWPTAGPTEPYGNAEAYRAATQALVESRAALDRGMLYLDARLAEAYPTVEIRVADVCTQVEDAVLVAALTRALTETAAAEWRRGEAAPAWRTELVRAASWRASRFGMSDKLLHPVNRTLVPAREASLALMHHTADALDEAGDRGRVAALFEELTRRGSGAARQHAAAAAGGSLEAVVDDLARRTGSAPTMRA